ncbi:MAG: hypothetical protein JXB14_06695 [Candidatus Altiarchaeota archaeon]|nr:hypothetical protein [Candidatus Altiarchaeota archaeon]
MSLKALNLEYQQEVQERERKHRESEGGVFSALKRLSNNTRGALKQRSAYPSEGRLEEILLNLEFERG